MFEGKDPVPSIPTHPSCALTSCDLLARLRCSSLGGAAVEQQRGQSILQ